MADGSAHLPAHSPLGASGTHRWMECPGSVGLSAGIVDEESDHAALGTAAHALGAACLAEGRDAWLAIGTSYEGFVVDQDMANAVQVYIDAIRRQHDSFSVEHRFHCPTIHRLFFGTTDCWAKEARRLHIWDYKHGAGVVVEVENNPQLMYYAAGVLESEDLWDHVDEIVLHVVQPRGFHFDGVHRQHVVKTGALVAWLEDVLGPAMERALISRDTKSGEHCRFCPVRAHACPQILKDIDELEAMMAELQSKGAAALTNEQIARILDLGEVFKIAAKAAKDTAFARMQSGHPITGWKLAAARSNRVWKDGAEGDLVKKFGQDAFTEPALKSPAQIEELPEGEKFTARLAFKPDAGLTVTKGDDARPAVNRETKSLFSPKPKARK